MEIIRYSSRWEVSQFLNHNVTLADLIRSSNLTSESKGWCSPDDNMLPIKIIIPEE